MRIALLLLLLLSTPGHGVTLNELSRLPGYVSLGISRSCSTAPDPNIPKRIEGQKLDCHLFSVNPHIKGSVLVAYVSGIDDKNIQIEALLGCLSFPGKPLVCVEIDRQSVLPSESI